jgi:hypothetical protein
MGQKAENNQQMTETAGAPIRRGLCVCRLGMKEALAAPPEQASSSDFGPALAKINTEVLNVR